MLTHKGVKTAYARAEINPYTVLFCSDAEFCIIKRLNSRTDRVSDELVILSYLGLLHIRRRVKVLDLGRKFHTVIRCVKCRYLVNSANAVFYVIPKCPGIASERCYRSHSGYNNSLHILLLHRRLRLPVRRLSLSSHRLYTPMPRPPKMPQDSPHPRVFRAF